MCSTRCNSSYIQNFETNHCNHVCQGLKFLNKYDEEFAKIFHFYQFEIENFEQIFKEKTPLIFVNYQPFIDFEMPEGYPEKVVNIGGIAISDNNEELSPIEIKALNNAESKDCLVYFSFGTIIDGHDINEQALFNIFNAFRLYKFIPQHMRNSCPDQFNRLLATFNLSQFVDSLPDHLKRHYDTF
uniref:Glucuronosyltransferase n=1 Tax=Meloidogyne hapla TaxID=6305 RepID=A0A1I8B6F2_MELHA